MTKNDVEHSRSEERRHLAWENLRGDKLPSKWEKVRIVRTGTYWVNSGVRCDFFCQKSFQTRVNNSRRNAVLIIHCGWKRIRIKKEKKEKDSKTFHEACALCCDVTCKFSWKVWGSEVFIITIRVVKITFSLAGGLVT